MKCLIIGSRNGKITDVGLVDHDKWFHLNPPGVDRLTIIDDFNPLDWTNSRIFQAWETLNHLD